MYFFNSYVISRSDFHRQWSILCDRTVVLQRRYIVRMWQGSHWNVSLYVACLTSQQHASVSQGRICSDNLTCCHTEMEVADQTFYLTQSQYTNTRPTSPSPDPLTPGAWQGSHWSANFLSNWYDPTPKKSRRKRDSNPGSSAPEADALTTRRTRRLATGMSMLTSLIPLGSRAVCQSAVRQRDVCRVSRQSFRRPPNERKEEL